MYFSGTTGLSALLIAIGNQASMLVKMSGNLRPTAGATGFGCDR